MTDIGTIFFLIFLEGALSLDNAIVLAVMTQHLDTVKRRRALTYGILGAFAFRLLSLLFVSFLMKSRWVKILGAAYLLQLAVRHFFFGDDEIKDPQARGYQGFWKTVVMVELMDVCFSVDSILAAIAISQKTYVVFIGGALGIVMMRFAASLFAKLLDRFSWLIHVAYGLVALIGLKLGYGALPTHVQEAFVILVAR